VFGNSLVFIGVGCLDTQLPNGALISLKLFDSLPVEGYIYKDSVLQYLNCLLPSVVETIISFVTR